jgi:hypothetical protein
MRVGLLLWSVFVVPYCRCSQGTGVLLWSVFVVPYCRCSQGTGVSRDTFRCQAVRGLEMRWYGWYHHMLDCVRVCVCVGGGEGGSLRSWFSLDLFKSSSSCNKYITPLLPVIERSVVRDPDWTVTIF